MLLLVSQTTQREPKEGKTMTQSIETMSNHMARDIGVAGHNAPVNSYKSGSLIRIAIVKIVTAMKGLSQRSSIGASKNTALA